MKAKKITIEITGSPTINCKIKNETIPVVIKARGSDTKKATYYLERCVVKTLNIYAAEQEKSVSEIVNRALKEYLRTCYPSPRRSNT